MTKGRPIKSRPHRRRPLLKLVLALALCGMAFGASAVGTLWIIERTGILAPRGSASDEGEDLTAEERRALERILRRAAPTQP